MFILQIISILYQIGISLASEYKNEEEKYKNILHHKKTGIFYSKSKKQKELDFLREKIDAQELDLSEKRRSLREPIYKDLVVLRDMKLEGSYGYIDLGEKKRFSEILDPAINSLWKKANNTL